MLSIKLRWISELLMVLILVLFLNLHLPLVKRLL